MVPGPVKVPQTVLESYLTNFGSGDLEKDYADLYLQTQINLQMIYGTDNEMVVMTGEGMLALWSALKSTLLPGDRVLSIASGMFGFGIADMARSIGASVRTIDIPYNQTITDWQAVERGIAEFRPKMITVVHCETPSGTLNPLQRLGELKETYAVPLLYVDAVSSAGGAPLRTDEWKIDLCLGGSQKVISAPAGMSFLSVSPRAWEIIDLVNYPGYDSLKAFHGVAESGAFPYTPYWHGTAALYTATELLVQEGLENVFRRHEDAAAYCRARLARMGLSLYPSPSAIQSPTLTAVNVPEKIAWEELDARFRRQGLVVGGNYGPLAGKVFRIGHMGTQANRALLEQACDAIEKVIASL
jgi:aspartate aminotransferase-like enzyme